ncbi:MAG TPA: hypothetical protein VHC21_03420 [Candidatus Saccharimonadales bacterium]|nr:hypothetical protein [Candidatus Saccharimonadales bacterium]
MYIETLQTPHPLKTADDVTEPLLASLDADTRRRELAEIAHSRPELYDAAVIETTDYVIGAVRKALWFPEAVKGGRPSDYERYGLSQPLPVASVTEGQFATCAGYTIIGSEALELAGVSHWVGFVNGHATLLLPLPSQPAIRLTDPLTPELNQDLRAATVRGSYQQAEADLRQYNRAALILNTRRLARQSSLSLPEAFRRIPWLKYSSEQGAAFEDERYLYDQPGFVSEQDRQSRQALRKYQVILNIFEAGMGRGLLEDYVEFKNDLAKEDYASAADCLRNLSGNYPEIDARESHADVKKLVSVLAARGDTEAAKELIEGYFSSFSLSHDSRIQESQADCLRLLARRTGDVSAAAKARELYEKAISSPHAFRQRLAGKLGKTAALCDGLSRPT